MGVLKRFKDIMSANINAILDKCENPAKMIDEYLRQLMEELADVKKETAAIIAEEKRTKRLVDENNEQIAKYDSLARKALTAGNEDDARVFLAKKQTFETKGIDLNTAYEAAKANSEKMRQMHDKLTNDIAELQNRREQIKAKVAVAKTQKKINDLTGNTDKVNDVMSAFGRMEAKADAMLDTADAMAELNSAPVDEAAELEKKYAADSNSGVEDALAKLKAEMGLN